MRIIHANIGLQVPVLQVFDFDFSAPRLSRRRRCVVPVSTPQTPETLEAHGVACLGADRG